MQCHQKKGTLVFQIVTKGAFSEKEYQARQEIIATCECKSLAQSLLHTSLFVIEIDLGSSKNNPLIENSRTSPLEKLVKP